LVKVNEGLNTAASQNVINQETNPPTGVIAQMRVLNIFLQFTVILTVFGAASITVEARDIVALKGISRGAIVIKTSQRRLYLGLGNGKAISYKVGVGRSNKQWTGKKYISSKRLKPAWSPTAQIFRDNPNIPKVIAGGSPRNPMGAAALLLSGNGQYAIHGTNKPGSIGGFVSYGCIRMHNKDIRDLYSRVAVGTRVTVLR
jgi:lipoprotein-anchoring transpeptidase ErfK/SrfK